jgi:hypothetical protein
LQKNAEKLNRVSGGVVRVAMWDLPENRSKSMFLAASQCAVLTKTGDFQVNTNDHVRKISIT